MLLKQIFISFLAILLLVFVNFFSLHNVQAASSISAIWAVDDGTKVKANDINNLLKAKNEIFDGKTIRVFGMKNETVAFQVILQGGNSKSSKVNVRLDSVGTIKNGIISNNPNTYFLNRNIELFKEIYLNVTDRSRGGLSWESWAEVNPQIPAGWTGPIPDPLIPLNLINNNFEVPAGKNQAVWVDIYIPKNIVPGVHKGDVVVEVDGKLCSLELCKIPIELTVLNATMPDEAPVKTMLWFSGQDEDQVVERYFKEASWDLPEATFQALLDNHFKLVRRHLITLVLGNDLQPNNQILKRLNGETFSVTNGYYGWGEGKGQDMYAVDIYGGSADDINPTEWSNWLKQNATGKDYFYYTYDEPDSDAFSEVNRIANQMKVLPTFVTHEYTNKLKVDIFTAFAGAYTSANATAGKVAGKQVWIYNGKRPHTGTFVIDDSAISPRVNPWIQYKENIPRWFYWESTYYNNYQGSNGRTNVYKNPQTFKNGGDLANGDGLLMYPGKDLIYPQEDLGFYGPLPSIRLKNWRRGIQDVAYLKLAKSSGHLAEHNAVLNTLVGGGILFGNSNEENDFQAISWPDDGESWVKERKKLANLFASGIINIFNADDVNASSDLSKDKASVINDNLSNQNINREVDTAFGKLIKLHCGLFNQSTCKTIYYLKNSKRYVFPNEKIYFSWFIDFSNVEEVSSSDMASYDIGGNIRYKPGFRMIKIVSDSKVYAVSSGGVLRWIKNEEIARSLYGSNWNQKIDDLLDSFFFNYSIGDNINSATDFNLVDVIKIKIDEDL